MRSFSRASTPIAPWAKRAIDWFWASLYVADHIVGSLPLAGFSAITLFSPHFSVPHNLANVARRGAISPLRPYIPNAILWAFDFVAFTVFRRPSDALLATPLERNFNHTECMFDSSAASFRTWRPCLPIIPYAVDGATKFIAQILFEQGSLAIRLVVAGRSSRALSHTPATRFRTTAPVSPFGPMATRSIVCTIFATDIDGLTDDGVVAFFAPPHGLRQWWL